MDFGSPLRRCTDVLLVTNAVLFAAQWLSRDALTLWGAKVNSLIAAGQVWRLLTSSLLHTGLFHLLVRAGRPGGWGVRACLVGCGSMVGVGEEQSRARLRATVDRATKFLTLDRRHATLSLQINSHALHTIGPHLEMVGGRGRFVSVYVAGALAGTTASFLLTPAPSVGASCELKGGD
jgi:hypothetical protein